MELKHKECFIPNIIKYWDLQAVSKYAREAAEFVNLYSIHRGINRFPALLMTFDLLADWDRVQARGIKLPQVPNLRRWVETESKLGNPALEAYCQKCNHLDMQHTLDWSHAVNQSIEDMVHGGLPPFPYVRESLQKALGKADILVCSQTPTEALVREWEQQGMDKFVFTIAGQECGTKAQHIAMASQTRYEPTKILMIGDAMGDLKAAQANNALFFPINPGAEDASWEEFYNVGLNRFFEGRYSGEYEEALVGDFMQYLPDTPPWKPSHA
jgi:phosphoglycolate phosphatase-like HAD superfamily hydrolase